MKKLFCYIQEVLVGAFKLEDIYYYIILYKNSKLQQE